MELVDTHSHLFLDEFESDRNNVVANALKSNVSKIVLPNIDSSTINSLHNLCRQYPHNFFPAMGLHPTSVKNNFDSELNNIYKYLKENKYVAIGEIGIDLYWDKSFIKQQCEAFEIQIGWSIETKLPIIIHSRESHNEIIQILRNYRGKGVSGIFHSFSGSFEQAKEIMELGFLIGINGVVTFKNSKLPDVLKEINIEKIVLETDSPYLTPVPFRGKRNESSYLIYIAKKIAEIKNISLDELARITTNNANKLFNFNCITETINN